MKSKMMMSVAGAIVAVLAMSSVADAQGFGISFGKGDRHGRHGRHHGGGFGVSIGFPIGHRQPVYCPPPVHAHSTHCRIWVPAQTQIVTEQVWVPGACQQVWVEPVYRTEFDHCGRPIRVLVAAGHYETVQEQGHYETVQRQVVVDGFWRTSCGF